MTGPRFETRMEGHDCVVAPSGELDMACIDAFRSTLAALNGRVIVDLSAVTFLDSSSIAVLVQQRKRLRSDGGTLVIRRPHELPRQVLKLTGLGDWIVD